MLLRFLTAVGFTFGCCAIALAQVNRDAAELDAAYQRGEALRAKGDLTEAIKQYQRALALAPKVYGPDDPSMASLLNNLGLLHQNLGQYDQAEPLLLKALRIWSQQPSPDHAAIALSLNNVGDLYRVRGQLDKAEQYVRSSLKLRETRLGKDHVDVAQSLHSLGLIHQLRSELAEADPLLKRALALRERHLGGDHLDVAAVLNSQAVLYVQMGLYGPADAAYRRCLAIREKRLGNDHPEVGYVVQNLGSLQATLGRYDAAVPLLRRSLAILEAKLGKEHHAVGSGLNSLAETYQLQGLYEEAEPLFLRGGRIWEERLGKAHPNVALNQYHLGVLYAATGRQGDALRAHNRGLSIRESRFGKDHPLTAMSLHGLALVRAAQGRWSEAVEKMERSRRIVRRHVAVTLPVLAEAEQLTYLQKRYEPEFQQALALGLAARHDERLAMVSAGWIINGKAVGQQALAEATLLARDGNDPRLAKELRELTAVRKELAALAFKTDDDAGRQAELARLSAREQQLAKGLRQAGGRFSRQDPWVELDEVRRALPANAMLVEFARVRSFDFRSMRPDQAGGAPRYAAWLIPSDGGGPIQILDLGDAAVIEERLRELRKALGSAAKNVMQQGEIQAEKEIRGLASGLAERVLHPLLPHLGQIDKLVLSPDADLWLVPWAALVLPDGKYLIERFEIETQISGRDLAPGGAEQATGQPLIIADPDFDLLPQVSRREVSQLTRGLQATRTRSIDRAFVIPTVGRLPGTLREAQAIAPSLQRLTGETPQVRTGKQALEAVVKTAVRPRVLVLSTHGFFLESPRGGRDNALLRCGLLLAGCNRRQEIAPGDEDGILTGIEIVGADLRGTELVVLSACDTGLGQVSQGEGVAGLRQAFQLAGAQSVVATLWQIPDRESTLVMSAFFQQLSDHQGKARALRDSQLKLIEARRGRNGAAHPFFWAAFVVTGK